MAQEHSSNIDPEILAQLGLTSEDVQNFSQQRQNERRLLKSLREFGAQEYEAKTHHDSLSNLTTTIDLSKGYPIGGDLTGLLHYYIPVFLSFHPGVAPRELPDSFKKALEKRIIEEMYAYESGSRARKELDYPPKDYAQRPHVQEVLAISHKVTSSFLLGFGFAAFNKGDWETAINSFDVATSGKLFEQEEIAEELRRLAEADKMAGVAIANIIQERIQNQSNPSS